MSGAIESLSDFTPYGWQPAKLSDVCEIQLGKMLSPKSKTGERPIPYLRNANVQWNRFDLAEVAEMDFTEEQEVKFKLRPGDLLVCEGGEPGRAAVWGGEIERCCYQKALHRLRPKNGAVDPHFMMFRLWLGARLGEFTDSHAQTTIAHLPAVRLKNLRVALPALPEQKRIAGILKEQLAAVERARAAAEAQLEAAQAFPAAYLRNVFATPDEADANRQPLGDVCQLLPSRSIATAGDTEIRAITTACLTESGFDPAGIKTAHMWSSDAEACVVSPNEVLLARSNTAALVGRVAMFPGEPTGTVASDLTIRIWAREEVAPQFLTAYLSFLYTTGYWRERAGGASGSMKKITRSQIRALPIPVPAMAKQRDVVNNMNTKMSRVRALDATLRNELQTIESLPESLLRSAFQGRL